MKRPLEELGERVLPEAREGKRFLAILHHRAASLSHHRSGFVHRDKQHAGVQLPNAQAGSPGPGRERCARH